MWKIIIQLLGCKNKDYSKAVKVGKDIYTINIEKHIPVQEQMKKWKDALDSPRTSD